MESKKYFLGLNRREIVLFKRLDTPKKIQDFLETLRFNFEKGGGTCMSPRCVIREGRAHCVEGAMFAAAVLWYHGYKPLLMDLRSTDRDYDHVVALFRQYGRWGAISKTNHAVLRYREPVYKTLRELAMSYFHEYFLDDGRKTMRDYSGPFDLFSHAGGKWLTEEESLLYIADALDRFAHISIIDRKIIANLRRADPVEIEAGKVVQWRPKKGRP